MVVYILNCAIEGGWRLVFQVFQLTRKKDLESDFCLHRKASEIGRKSPPSTNIRSKNGVAMDAADIRGGSGGCSGAPRHSSRTESSQESLGLACLSPPPAGALCRSVRRIPATRYLLEE